MSIQKQKRKKDELSKIWTKIRPVLGDYFDFIVADLIKGVLSETSITFEAKDSLKQIRQIFMKFWRLNLNKFMLNNENQINNKIFQRDLEQILRKNLKISQFLQDIIINIISNLSFELINLFIKPNLEKNEISNQKYQINESYYKYLTHLTEEYILVSYFDYVILSESFKVILYTEHATFAQIYELRIQLVEIFREFLYDTTKYQEIPKFFDSIRKNLQIINSIDFLENIIISFFITVAQSKKHWKLMLKNCKNQLKRRLKVVKNNLQITEIEAYRDLFIWVEKQIYRILLNIKFDAINNKITLHEVLVNLFEKQLLKNLTYEQITTKLHNIFNRYFYPKSLNDSVKSTQFDLTIRTLYSFSKLLNHQIIIDPSLENLSKIIKLTEKDSLPGGDEYII